MKRINSEQCSRTWEGTAAEVALECPRTTQSTPSQALSGAAAAWEGELVQALPSSAAHPIARTGIRKDVLPAGFLFPSGRQFPIPAPPSAAADRLGMLLSFCAPSRSHKRSSPWNSGLVLPLVSED